LVCSIVTVLSIASRASGFVASALLRENGSIPGAPAGQIVSSLNNTATNHAGGYSVTVNSSGGAGALSHVWGNASGGAGTVMRTEGTFGSLVQTAFESFYGMADAGQIAYSATGTGGPIGGFDSVWLDDVPLAVEGEPIASLPGLYWRFGSRPGVTADGIPYWVGGTTDTVGGPTQNYGLFLGASATVVLLGGQVVPGLPAPLDSSSSIDFDYRFSALAAHSIVPVLMDTTSTTDGVITVDGSGLLIDGTLVREGRAVPAAAGGLPGELWGTFDFTGITESGEWFFTANTSAALTTDEIIVKNGSIIHREGDVLDGRTLTGDIEGAYMNEDGDVAYVWDVMDATALEALFVNDELALLETDLVDLDGDGTVEATSHLADFTGISALTMSDRDASGVVSLYFTADIDTAGTSSTTDDIEGFFCLLFATSGATSVASSGAPASPPSLLMTPNPSAGPATIRYDLADRGHVSLAVFDVAGRLVTRLEDGVREGGPHAVVWDGRGADGRPVGAGAYFLRLEAGGSVAREKVIRLR
jgi:hypothetical protein